MYHDLEDDDDDDDLGGDDDDDLGGHRRRRRPPVTIDHRLPLPNSSGFSENFGSIHQQRTDSWVTTGTR
ncbi:unnamed protein product [Camellia sinensis]